MDAMGGLKLFGMRAAYDEIVATAVKRQHEPQTRRRRPADGRALREAGPLDQVPDRHRQAAARQGHRGVRLRRHPDQRDPGPRPRRRRLPGPSAQPGPGRRHRHRQDPPRRRHRPRLHPRRRPRALLQCRRPRQQARGRGPRRPTGPHRRPPLPPRLRRSRRTRLPPLRPGRRTAALPPHQPPLRADLGHRHHQPRLRRMARRLRRRQDDHRAPRPAHPPLRHRRDRQRKLALQEPRLRPGGGPDPSPPPQPLRRIRPSSSRREVGQNWTPIAGQDCAPIDKKWRSKRFSASSPS